MAKSPQPTSHKAAPPRDAGKKSTGIETGKLSPRIHNRRATFDYFILDKIECGIALVGSEVKSVRKGHVQLGQSFARLRDGQVWLMGAHIEEYVEANQLNHDPTRTRRLLLHRREIRRLQQRLQKEQGSTLIPLEMYFRRGYVKVLLGIAKGKKLFDKRASIKEREDKRNMQKALRHR
ncbi:MAG TPA: SsrA-binding protein SmpB [Phycisphaerae bacterium]|jgi:SsrA-binding protein|nr:SsrA-binding protein SmpB [Phycisphaerae bacterium]